MAVVSRFYRASAPLTTSMISLVIAAMFLLEISRALHLAFYTVEKLDMKIEIVAGAVV